MSDNTSGGSLPTADARSLTVTVSPPSALPVVVGVVTGVLSLVGIGLTLAALRRRRIESIDREDIASIFPSRHQNGLVLTLESGDQLELSYRAVGTIGRSAKEWRRYEILDDDGGQS